MDWRRIAGLSLLIFGVAAASVAAEKPSLADAAELIDDQQGSAEYKRHLIQVFLRRAFLKALQP